MYIRYFFQSRGIHAAEGGREHGFTSAGFNGIRKIFCRGCLRTRRLSTGTVLLINTKGKTLNKNTLTKMNQKFFSSSTIFSCEQMRMNQGGGGKLGGRLPLGWIFPLIM